MSFVEVSAHNLKVTGSNPVPATKLPLDNKDLESDKNTCVWHSPFYLNATSTFDESPSEKRGLFAFGGDEPCGSLPVENIAPGMRAILAGRKAVIALIQYMTQSYHEARMTVKTTLSFTDRHHQFLSEKVGQGVFATQSAAVAAALEQMMQDEQERDVALLALTQEIRARMETPREVFIDQDDAFAAARRTIGAARGA